MRSTPVLDGHESAALEVAAASAGGSSGFLHRAGAFFLHEFREMLWPRVGAGPGRKSGPHLSSESDPPLQSGPSNARLRRDPVTRPSQLELALLPRS